MSTAIDLEVTAYASRVRTALADLPAAAREDLLADLEAHLSEVAEESGEPLETRLGQPEAYAAELRAAAGLAPAADPRPASRRLSPRQAALATLGFLRELLPAWWVLRGVLLAWAVARPLAGNAGVLLLALLTVPASVLLGRRTRAEPRLAWAGYVASAATLVLAIAVAGVATGGRSAAGSTSSSEPAPAPPPDLSQVTNLYPYDKDGRPLSDVQLFDQDGNPVLLGTDTDHEGRLISSVPRRTADGRLVTNVYPREQNVEDLLDPAAPPSPVQPPAVQPPKLSGG